MRFYLCVSMGNPTVFTLILNDNNKAVANQ